MGKAKGPRHSYAAATKTLSLILHNVQAQNRLICSSHNTVHCYAHSLPNVPKVSIFHAHNSGGCSLRLKQSTNNCFTNIVSIFVLVTLE